MMDRCVNQSETRIAVLRMGLVGGVHKKGCFAKQCKKMIGMFQEKMQTSEERQQSVKWQREAL